MGRLLALDGSGAKQGASHGDETDVSVAPSLLPQHLKPIGQAFNLFAGNRIEEGTQERDVAAHPGSQNSGPNQLPSPSSRNVRRIEIVTHHWICRAPERQALGEEDGVGGGWFVMSDEFVQVVVESVF